MQQKKSLCSAYHSNFFCPFLQGGKNLKPHSHILTLEFDMAISISKGRVRERGKCVIECHYCLNVQISSEIPKKVKDKSPLGGRLVPSPRGISRIWQDKAFKAGLDLGVV